MKLSDALRELLRSGAGRFGIFLLVVLGATAIYVISTFPAQFGERFWSNPTVWSDNPKAVPPVWVNRFSEQQLQFVYDFPDIRKNLALHVRLWMFHFAMWFIQKIGGKVSPPTPEYETTVDYVDVCTQKISDAIMLKLDEYHKQRAAREDIMIVVGASDFREISRVNEDFQFVMEIRYAQKVEDRSRLRTDYYLCGVPVFVLRDFDGIAIMPDFSKQTVRKLIDSRFS